MLLFHLPSYGVVMRYVVVTCDRYNAVYPQWIHLFPRSQLLLFYCSSRIPEGIKLFGSCTVAVFRYAESLHRQGWRKPAPCTDLFAEELTEETTRRQNAEGTSSVLF